MTTTRTCLIISEHETISSSDLSHVRSVLARRGGRGSEYGGNRKLPYFRSGKWKYSAHFSGFGHKYCKRNENILFRVSENENVVHISADSDTKIVNETEMSFSEG